MTVLIVGQGIAGSVLAWTLRRLGVEVRVADTDAPGSASAAAAGIINPVTGKRYVESWRFTDFWPKARMAYRAIEADLGVNIWHEMPIIRLLQGPQEINDWELRRGQPSYADWLDLLPDAADWEGLALPHEQVGIIRLAARVDFGALTGAWRAFCVREGLFLPEKIPAAALPDVARTYDAVICCEGWRAIDNPFFPNLPWQLAKGEALLIRLRDAVRQPRQILKRNILLAPVGENLFWAGANYDWQFADGRPSAEGRAFLIRELQQLLAAPYEIVDHIAGVRPAVRDRRPLIGRSPLHTHIYMFNGLGTKGALLAPFWAEHLAEHLLHGVELDAVVRVGR